MDAPRTIIFRLILSAILLCQAIGAAYFASITNNQLRPYFTLHSMDADTHTAQIVFVYLFMSAVFASGGFVSVSTSVCKCGRNVPEEQNEEKKASCCALFSRAVVVCVTIVMLALGGITAKASWSWRRHFEIQNEGALAAKSHGLAGMTVVILTITACSILSSLFSSLALHLARRNLEKKHPHATASGAGTSALETLTPDIEMQRPPMAFTRM